MAKDLFFLQSNHACSYKPFKPFIKTALLESGTDRTCTRGQRYKVPHQGPITVNREIYSACPAHVGCQWTQIADTELCRAHTIGLARSSRPKKPWLDRFSSCRCYYCWRSVMAVSRLSPTTKGGFILLVEC